MKKKIIYNLLGAIALGFVSYSTMCARVPTIYSPFSFAVVLPAFYIHDYLKLILPPFLFLPTVTVLTCSVIPLFFMAWSRGLYSGIGKIPRRSVVFFSIIIVLSLIYLIGSWKDSLKYSGQFHTLAIYGINLVFWATMVYLYLLNRKRPSVKLSFVFHWFSFAWLAWVAFPWLGELL